MPPHVLLPRPIGNTGGNMPHGQTAGYLGKTYDPFVLNADPTDPNFKVPDLLPPDYVTASCGSPARSALASSTGRSGRSRPAADARLLDSNFEQAYTLIRRATRARRSTCRRSRMPSGEVRPDPVRQELPAGPAADRGGRAVRHRQHVRDRVQRDHLGHPRLGAVQPDRVLREQVGPNFDNAYTALLEDLADRGMLDTTMVLAMGEFGRTPKINPAGGRDHWPQCWSMAMAGGGVKGGQVIGASDEIGAYPKDRPVPAAAVAATIMYGLGIDLDKELPGAQGRPMPMVDRGIEPVKELF